MSNLTDFLYPKATEQQAKDGVSNSVLMTPQSTKQYVDEQKGAAHGVASLNSSGQLQGDQIDLTGFAGFYTGGNEGQTDYPVGTTLLARISGQNVPRNTSVTVGLSTSDSFSFSVVLGAATYPLSGMWRVRGGVAIGGSTSDRYYLVQRVA